MFLNNIVSGVQSLEIGLIPINLMNYQAIKPKYFKMLQIK
jgi:hypothetical protein